MVIDGHGCVHWELTLWYLVDEAGDQALPESAEQPTHAGPVGGGEAAGHRAPGELALDELDPLLLRHDHRDAGGKERPRLHLELPRLGQ